MNLSSGTCAPGTEPRIPNHDSEVINHKSWWHDAFQQVPYELLEEIDEDEDRMVAYKVDARCAKETLTAGTMVCSEKAVCYLV